MRSLSPRVENAWVRTPQVRGGKPLWDTDKPFETSRREKPHNFVDVVKENGLETIILSSSSDDVTFLTPFMTRGRDYHFKSLCLLRNYSVVWDVQTNLWGILLDMIDLLCVHYRWGPNYWYEDCLKFKLWLETWCGLKKNLKSSWTKRSRRGHTHTHTHTHYILTQHQYIRIPVTLQHLVPCPRLPTINHDDKWSLLITVLLIRTGFLIRVWTLNSPRIRVWEHWAWKPHQKTNNDKLETHQHNV